MFQWGGCIENNQQQSSKQCARFVTGGISSLSSQTPLKNANMLSSLENQVMQQLVSIVRSGVNSKLGGNSNVSEHMAFSIEHSGGIFKF